MKKFTSKTQKVGEIGEKIAEMFLVKHGFTILERNFTCKAGEIDIICQKGNKVHFVEVKSVISRGGAHACPPSRDLGSRRETYWQMDGISVFINSLDKKANVEYLEHINII